MTGKSKILAVLGLCGVGKSEAARIIHAEYGHSIVYFGGQITNEVARRGMASGPESEREVREQLRAEYGMDAVARLAEREITDLLATGERVVIDGVYSQAEIDYIKSTLPGPISTIAVHSRKSLRYRRMERRPVRPLTPGQLDERDIREIAALDKATPIALADFHLVNDGTMADLKAGVRQTLECLDPSTNSGG